MVPRRGSSLFEPNLDGLVFVGSGFERSVLSDLVLSDLEVSDLERSRRSGRDERFRTELARVAITGRATEAGAGFEGGELLKGASVGLTWS